MDHHSLGLTIDRNGSENDVLLIENKKSGDKCYRNLNSNIRVISLESDAAIVSLIMIR